VVETYVSAYSHPDFAKSAEDAVASWKFRPDEDQAASPKRYAFRINFEREGLTVVQGDFFEITNNFFPHQRPKTEVVTARLKDLDAIPEPISFAVPSYPGELKSQRIEGATTVGFYIDEDGMVRVPAIVKSTRPEFATAVLAAIKQWKFAAPTSQGQPTSVHAVQRFIFTPGKPTSTAPAAQ
jgi:TonB family protein